MITYVNSIRIYLPILIAVIRPYTMSHDDADTDLPDNFEVYIEEDGKLVAMAATVDIELGEVSLNEGNFPKECNPFIS